MPLIDCGRRHLRHSGALEAMPDLAKPPPPGKKQPSAPSTEEVNAMLARASGWLSVAVALGALAGLRQGEVRALEAAVSRVRAALER